ncbi:MAG: hypothetical protein ACI9W4_001335 [Rhodothermales bacterium]
MSGLLFVGTVSAPSLVVNKPDCVPHTIKHMKLDEHDIARLLAGSLEEDEQKALLARLAADSDARELLAMGLEALQAAEEAAD